MRNILFQVARIVVTFILLVILFTRINWAVFFQNVYHANYFLIAIATLLGYAGIYISVLVWNIFLKRKHLHLSKGQLFSVYLAGSFFNNFLPTSFGGDAFKIVHLRLKHPGQDAAIVSSIFFQRVCGFLALLTSNLCLALLFYTLVRSDWRLSVIEVIIFLGFLALVLFIRFHKFIHYIQKLFRGRIAKKVGAFIQDILTVEQNRDIYVGVFYSVIFVLLAAVAQLLYFNSLGVNPNFLYIFFVITIVQIAGVLPISLNSIGVAEGLNVFLFSLIGVASETALAVALIGRVATIIVSLTGGLSYLIKK